MADKKADNPPNNQSLFRAFRCAGSGLLHACVTQRNMKIHLVFAVLALVLGLVLQIDQVGWFAIVFCIALVISAECINTSIESLVDLVSPDYHEKARIAKDCAAAAVLVLAILSLVVAFLVYVPAFLRLGGFV